jgi:hypothetical protein
VGAHGAAARRRRRRTARLCLVEQAIDGAAADVGVASVMMVASSTSTAALTVATTFAIARPIRFQVSSTRPAPARAAESSATRRFSQPKPPDFFATSMVRATRRLSVTVRQRLRPDGYKTSALHPVVLDGCQPVSSRHQG